MTEHEKRIARRKKWERIRGIAGNVLLILFGAALIWMVVQHVYFNPNADAEMIKINTILYMVPGVILFIVNSIKLTKRIRGPID